MTASTITQQLVDALRHVDYLLNELADERTPANVEMTPAEAALVGFRKHTQSALAAFDALPAEDVVERVARAICNAFPMTWGAVLEDQRDHLRSIARAAIAALPADPDLEALRARIEALEAEKVKLREAHNAIIAFPRERLVALGPGFGANALMNISRAALSEDKP